MEFFNLTRGSGQSMNELYAALSGVFAAGGAVTVMQVDGAFSFTTGTLSVVLSPAPTPITADPISGQLLTP